MWITPLTLAILYEYMLHNMAQSRDTPDSDKPNTFLQPQPFRRI